jgi:hypothetical protein
MPTKKSDKESLIQVCRLRARIAEAKAAAIAAKRKAEVRAILKKRYNDDKDVSRGEQLYNLAESLAAKANEEIARLAEKTGWPVDDAPTLELYYHYIPTYCQDYWDRNTKRVNCRISKLQKEAALQIERTAIETQMRLIAEHLTLADAKALIHAIPAAAELMPELKFEDLQEEAAHAVEVTDPLEPDVPFW